MSGSDSSFVPRNPIEVMLVEGHAGRASVNDLLKVFLNSHVAVPSASELVDETSPILPMVCGSEEFNSIAVFSDLERAKEAASLAGWVVVMTGREVLERMPEGYGLILNPGYKFAFEIPHGSIADTLRNN